MPYADPAADCWKKLSAKLLDINIGMQSREINRGKTVEGAENEARAIMNEIKTQRNIIKNLCITIRHHRG